MLSSDFVHWLFSFSWNTQTTHAPSPGTQPPKVEDNNKGWELADLPRESFHPENVRLTRKWARVMNFQKGSSYLQCQSAFTIDNQPKSPSS